MLPIIALYAFAGYRVLPALQNIYNSISQLRFVSHKLIICTTNWSQMESRLIQNLVKIYLLKKLLVKKYRI